MEKSTASRHIRSSVLTGLLIAVLLAALPVAVWLDLTNLAEAALRRQATDLNSVISSVRGYYASNVVGRVLANPGSTKVVHNYEAVPGAGKNQDRWSIANTAAGGTLSASGGMR